MYVYIYTYIYTDYIHMCHGQNMVSSSSRHWHPPKLAMYMAMNSCVWWWYQHPQQVQTHVPRCQIGSKIQISQSNLDSGWSRFSQQNPCTVWFLETLQTAFILLDSPQIGTKSWQKVQKVSKGKTTEEPIQTFLYEKMVPSIQQLGTHGDPWHLQGSKSKSVKLMLDAMANLAGKKAQLAMLRVLMRISKNRC